MLITQSQLSSIPILSLHTGEVLSYTAQPIIDPRQLKIVAFYCSGPAISGSAVLHVSDIREFSNMGFIIDSVDNLMDLSEDLVRLQEVINLNFNLVGKQVRDTHKKKLGAVQGYSIDDRSFYIIKLNVKQTFWQSLIHSGLLIDRTQITEITPDHITVRSTDVEVRQEAPKPIVENPFRKPQQHQPHTMQQQNQSSKE